MTTESIDPQLFADFLDESLDSLSGIDRLVLALPDDRRDFDALATIFRAVHSLKGNAGFFRLLQVRRLAHALENVLDDLRVGKLAHVPRDPLLNGLDLLRRSLEASRGGRVPDDDPALDRLCEELARVREATARSVLPLAAQDPQGVPGLVAELVAQLGKMPNRSAPRSVGDALLALVAELHDIAPPGSAAAAAVAACRSALDTVLPVLGWDPVLRELLQEQMGVLESVDAWAGGEPAPPQVQVASAGSVEPTPEHSAAENGAIEKTMRIPERSIDAFLGYVGELVVVEEVFQHLNRLAADAGAGRDDDFVRRLRQNTDTFATLSRELRESILQLRLVPARQVLQKAPRLAYDVAERRGKKVRVEVVGEGLQIDKSHLDLLDAPLTHLVNNAVDHGIETPEARVRGGKPPEGLVRLELREADDHLLLEIRDDGKGLDLGALRDKAVALGMIPPGQALDNQQLVALLFLPGVSTAEAVTDISGRGVGMDVVYSRIHDAGGRVEVETESGKGCLFRLVLPQSVRTQIVEGFVVRVADGRFLFPLSMVGEVFPLEADRTHSVPGRGDVVEHGGHVLPLVRLARLLSTDGAGDSGTVVVGTLDQIRVALLVDEVLGIHKTVVKPLGAVGAGGDLYEGVGMMGDGTMALILGVAGLGRLVREASETKKGHLE